MVNHDERPVMLYELADALGMSTNRLRELIRHNRDFPVLYRGREGVPFQFDLGQVKQWFSHRKTAEDAAKAKRKEELAQLQRELFGTP
jgi:phage terminase Nu1 subunit (DNA packaging protein)